jgi:hypothetical protein
MKLRGVDKFIRNRGQQSETADGDQIPAELTKCKSRIMYIENKSSGLEGPASIGRVYYSKSGKTLYYRDQRFRSLKGSGFKANYYDVDTGDEYWISGPRKDRNDRLYGGQLGVVIDDDAIDEYEKMINGSK